MEQKENEALIEQKIEQKENEVLNEGLIRKSIPLIYAEWTHLDIKHLKLIEAYLSKIDVKNNITSVTFSKKEFTELINYEDSRNLKKATFDKILSDFLAQQINIDLEDGKGYHKFNLFSDAKCYIDPEEQQAMIDIDCNTKLASVFINLRSKDEGYKYIAYRIENTKNITSSYALKLYNLLLTHTWGNFQWTVELDELKKLLGVNDKSYENFKLFNYHILKKAQTQINENTDISFEYEKIIKKRATTGIVFKIKKKNYKKPIVLKENLDASEKEKIYPEVKEKLKKNDFNFTKANVLELIELISDKYEALSFEETRKRILEEIDEKIQVYNEYERNHTIHNIYRTFRSAIKDDWKTTSGESLNEISPVNDLILDTMLNVPVFEK